MTKTNLGDLHAIIQAAMGWWGYHPHHFIVGETYYSIGTGLSPVDLGYK